MDKYDYITATTTEEKLRLENLIKYMEENHIDENLKEYKERYKNICKYHTLKDKYLEIINKINKLSEEREELYNKKNELEVDNLLLEETLITKFNEDTNNKYKNISYEEIKLLDNNEEKELLSIIIDKESDYNKLIIKRNKLKEILNKEKYSNTYNTLISQDILIEKEDELLDNIFLLENNIKIAKEEKSNLEEEAMELPILKILYEFWIVDSYNPQKVNRNNLFKENKILVNYKSHIDEEPKKEEKIIKDLNLPGIDEDTFIDINGRNYIK